MTSLTEKKSWYQAPWDADFSKATNIPLYPCVPPDLLAEANDGHQGCWIKESSYVALAGTLIVSEPLFQSAEIEVSFKTAGWHHVFLRCLGSFGLKKRLHVRFSDEAMYTPLIVEQQESGCKDIYLCTADLTNRSLFINPYGEYAHLDCVRIIPLGKDEVKEQSAMRSRPPTRAVTGMCDFHGEDPGFRPVDQEARSVVYAHARAGFTKIYWRTLAVRCEYRTKIHEMSTIGVPGRYGCLERYDLLAQAADAAKECGIELHPWLRLNNSDPNSRGRRAPDTAFRRRNPEKVMLNADGSRASHKLSFAYPEVRRHKIEIMKEMAGYGVAGIMIDTIRPPCMVKFDQPIVDAYLEKTGRDPRKPDESVKEEWLRFRADRSATQLLREARQALNARGKFELSVRTTFDLRFNLDYGCDVEAWMNEGLVDTLVVAPYCPGPMPRIFDIREIRGMVPASVKLFVKTWRCGSMTETENLTAHMYDQGADGVLLYESEALVAQPFGRGHVWNLRRPDTTRRLRSPKEQKGDIHA